MADDGELLRAFLAARSVPCPGCSYDLRGLTGSACPECGQQISLSVSANPQPLGPFLLLLLPSALTTGISLFVLVLLVGFGIPRPGRKFYALALLLATAILNIVASVAVYRRRAQFFRLFRLDGNVRGRWVLGNWVLQSSLMAVAYYLGR